MDRLCAGIASITKDVSPDNITIGDSVTWTLTATLPLRAWSTSTRGGGHYADGFVLDGIGLDHVPGVPADRPDGDAAAPGQWLRPAAVGVVPR